MRRDGETAVLSSDCGREVLLTDTRLKQIVELFPDGRLFIALHHGELSARVWCGARPNGGGGTSPTLAAIIVALMMIENAEQKGRPFPEPGWTAGFLGDRLDHRDTNLKALRQPQPNTVLLQTLRDRIELVRRGCDPVAELGKRRKEKVAAQRAERRQRRKAERAIDLTAARAIDG